MTKYRDLLVEQEGRDVGSVVGGGLDRLEREVTGYEINAAVQFYEEHKDKINSLPINARRQAIHDFIEKGIVPDYIKR
ncbi:hypothetical protein [Ectothiorhodospira variabilis]|uniref:hypothetical protein n=1 Tax=Ectothiorhodospira variabilis TaxID=505694 RepID=UPI001EFA5E7C|nr:hypothetical protein [Ectothiorhodospira variabilis]MCG5493248.1 hypothetical protein [Ectothiorhodospira variabilis]MCG5502577.1 hypothetical protein [Ectothiorhodospira variabilis]MCG5505657.1 hypothetical protein [Ectothiorhodospira variabilis]